MVIRRLVFLLLALVVVKTPAAYATETSAAAFEALKRPGTVAIMRHALAPGGGDPDNFALNDCATQRNLDEAGREQARRIGEALKDAGIVFDRVLTSQWCRCRDTATLLDVAPVEDFRALNSFFQDRRDGPAQTREVRALLDTLPADEKVILVTHQVNITGLTGDWVTSGEIFVLEAGEGGIVDVVGKILIDP